MMVVGVVKNSKHSEVSEETRRFIYLPYTQLPNINQMTFYARSAITPESLMPTIRGKVRDIDPSLPVTAMKTLEAQIAESLYGQRLMTTLSRLRCACCALCRLWHLRRDVLSGIATDPRDRYSGGRRCAAIVGAVVDCPRNSLACGYWY